MMEGDDIGRVLNIPVHPADAQAHVVAARLERLIAATSRVATTLRRRGITVAARDLERAIAEARL